MTWTMLHQWPHNKKNLSSNNKSCWGTGNMFVSIYVYRAITLVHTSATLSFWWSVLQVRKIVSVQLGSYRVCKFHCFKLKYHPIWQTPATPPDTNDSSEDKLHCELPTQSAPPAIPQPISSPGPTVLPDPLLQVLIQTKPFFSTTYGIHTLVDNTKAVLL